MLSRKPFQISVVVFQLGVYHLDFKVIWRNYQISPRKFCGHLFGVTRQLFQLMIWRCSTVGLLCPGHGKLFLLIQGAPLSGQSESAPNPMFWQPQSNLLFTFDPECSRREQHVLGGKAGEREKQPREKWERKKQTWEGPGIKNSGGKSWGAP